MNLEFQSWIELWNLIWILEFFEYKNEFWNFKVKLDFEIEFWILKWDRIEWIEIEIWRKIFKITWILKKNFENMMQFYPKWWMNLKNLKLDLKSIFHSLNELK